MTTLYNMFNFDPIETTIKTTSYTIPEGRYALAYPSFSQGSSSAGSGTHSISSGGLISLNSVILFKAPRNHNFFFLVSGQSCTIESYSQSFSISAVGGAANWAIAMSTYNFLGNVTSGQYISSIGHQAATFSSNGASTTVQGLFTSIDNRQEKYKNGIWVKSGDVLAGTNALGSAYEWTITEFNSLPS